MYGNGLSVRKAIKLASYKTGNYRLLLLLGGGGGPGEGRNLKIGRKKGEGRRKVKPFLTFQGEEDG